MVECAGKALAILPAFRSSGWCVGYFFELDKANSVFLSGWEGSVTDDELDSSCAAAIKFALSHPLCKGILDFTRATSFDISSEAIWRLAKSPPVPYLEKMHVIVAPTEVIFGLGRMYSMLGDETRPNLHVVRTMKEAYDLLGIKDPQFRRLSLK
jgi:hypothetical protein